MVVVTLPTTVMLPNLALLFNISLLQLFLHLDKNEDGLKGEGLAY